MTIRTPEEVKFRIEDAKDIEKRLPSVKGRGYGNSWNNIIKLKDGLPIQKNGPIEKSVMIERYMEVMKWMAWLKQVYGNDYYDIVWNPRETPTYLLAKKYGVSRTSINNRRNHAYEVIAKHLNGTLQEEYKVA